MKKYLAAFLVGIFLGASGVSLAVVLTFPDVPQNAFYYDALQEMVDRGVVGGYQNGNFGPDDPVTRGQFVQMLSKYNQSLTTYHVKDVEHGNDVGILIDYLCEKFPPTESDAFHADFSNLCFRRIESIPQ